MIVAPKVPATNKPEIKVTVMFTEREHGPTEREEMFLEICEVVGKHSRRDRGRVQVDFNYQYKKGT